MIKNILQFIKIFLSMLNLKTIIQKLKVNFSITKINIKSILLFLSSNFHFEVIKFVFLFVLKLKPFFIILKDTFYLLTVYMINSIYTFFNNKIWLRDLIMIMFFLIIFFNYFFFIPII